MTEDAAPAPSRRMRVKRLHLTNFLSYRRAVLELGDLVALVGPNASGKSNAVAAIKLLREIPLYGLPTAINRRGGFDQLRHRSHGHPYDPAIRLDFQTAPGLPESHYEVSLRALSGKRYEVKSETAEVNEKYGTFSFSNLAGRFAAEDRFADNVERYPAARDFRLPPGQSAVNLAASYGSLVVGGVLSGLRTVEVNPARVADLQEPSSTRSFEPDGSNTASIYEDLPSGARQELIDELAAIVPGIDRIEVRRLADKVTLSFGQRDGQGRRREFLAKQMSDGTLRAFSILLAMLQPSRPGLLVVEEPEIAIHLGALRTLVDILRQHAEATQILMTTHSADVIDALDIDSLRVVWSAEGSSHIAPVASHTREPVRRGLITPGELLRSDSLDPAVA